MGGTDQERLQFLAQEKHHRWVIHNVPVEVFRPCQFLSRRIRLRGCNLDLRGYSTSSKGDEDFHLVLQQLWEVDEQPGHEDRRQL